MKSLNLIEYMTVCYCMLSILYVLQIIRVVPGECTESEGQWKKMKKRCPMPPHTHTQFPC